MPSFAHLWQRKKKAVRGPTIHSKPLRVEQLEDRALLSLLGQSLFPADNPWNQQHRSAPVASNSAAIMSSIVNKYGDGRLHPDFGQDYRNSGPLYGIPYNVVHGNSVAKVHVVIDAYPSESDIRGRADSRQCGDRGRPAERPDRGCGQPRRLAPDRLGRGQQRRLRVLPRLAAERERRPPMARRRRGGLGHEDQHLPHDRLDLGRRRGPGGSARAGSPRRGPADQRGRPGGDQPRDPLHLAELR